MNVSETELDKTIYNRLEQREGQIELVLWVGVIELQKPVRHTGLMN